MKEHRENIDKVDPPKFSEAVELFKREVEHDATLKPQSRNYRLLRLGKLQRTWPELWNMGLNEIAPQACKEWSAKLVNEICLPLAMKTYGHHSTGGETACLLDFPRRSGDAYMYEVAAK